jgi:hypothetical protein
MLLMLISAAAAPANEDCSAAAPQPLLSSRDVARHRFRRLPQNAAQESAVLDGVPVRLETSGCADAIETRLTFDLPVAADPISALRRFVEAHAAALARTPLALPPVVRALREGKLGGRVCLSKDGARPIAVDARCGLTMSIVAQPQGAATTRVRVTLISEL